MSTHGRNVETMRLKHACSIYRYVDVIGPAQFGLEENSLRSGFDTASQDL
jgi:hypothetical protein